jgi:hypothetical protein
MASQGEETGAGYAVGGMKETSIVAETDSERKSTGSKLTGKRRRVFFKRRQRNPRGIFL